MKFEVNVIVETEDDKSFVVSCKTDMLGHFREKEQAVELCKRITEAIIYKVNKGKDNGQL